MALEIVNMLLPDSDLTIRYDFGGVSVQDKIYFLSIVFIILKDVVEEQQSISEDRYVDIYNEQYENIVSDLNGVYNFREFRRFFIAYFGEKIVREDVEPIRWTFLENVPWSHENVSKWWPRLENALRFW